MKTFIAFNTIWGLFYYCSFAQISLQWEKEMPFTNVQNYINLKNKADCSYILVDTNYYDLKVYKICKNDTGNELLGNIIKVPNSVELFYSYENFNNKHFIAGYKRSGNNTQAQVQTFGLLKESFSVKNKYQSSLFTEINSINNSLIAVGLASLSNPNVNIYDGFNAVFSYKLNSALQPTDSISMVIDSSQSNFILRDKTILHNQVRLFLSSAEPLIHDVTITENLGLSTKNVLHIAPTDSFDLFDFSTIKISDSLYTLSVLLNEINQEFEVSFGRIKNGKYTKLNRINTGITQKNNENYHLVSHTIDNRITFSLKQNNINDEDLVFFATVDIKGNVENLTTYSLNSLLNNEGYWYTGIENSLVLDSTFILKGNCADSSFNYFNFITFIKPPFSITQIIDSVLINEIWLEIIRSYDSNGFLVLGNNLNSSASSVENTFFKYYQLEDFTLHNKKIFVSEPETFFSFPNPTSSQLNFTQLPQHLWVYSTTGALVYQNQNPQPTLNLNLPNGMYFLQAQFEDGLKTQTLIIQQQ